MNGNDSNHSNYMDLTTESEKEKNLDRPPRNYGMKENLRSILELPTKFQCIFEFPFFNIIQSHILDDVLYSDAPFVISAPTGSGKTVVFELAIIRLLMNFEKTHFTEDYKIIYVAPVKALCSERLTDWHLKFSKIGLSCIVVTGDSDNVTYKMLQKYQIIITTPEKWDSLTRNAQDNPIIREVKLFMIDEVHLLNEETRGPILEAIVSRMKIFRKNNSVRFIAVSATIPNIEDIADWLGNSGAEPAIYFKIGEELRPVKLKKVVLGYSCKPGTPAFKFDINLNYKLQSIIMQYSEGKPTLIFCSTRKGVELTAKHISQQITFHLTAEQKIILKNCAQKMLDNKMKSQLINGVGSHHAGMTVENRTLIEDIFRAGHLPVLATTSTLAMGVNLPAHLVIIKSTERYVQGEVQNYTDANLLQMIGRAGRPQYDTHATVVIMTKMWQKEHYEKFLCGTELIESNLHRHLTQHLNAEVVLGVITDIAIALEWIRYTFLYVRALKNPKYYNIAADTKDKIEKRLQDICQIEINALHRYGMLQIDQQDGFSVSPTNTGKLMATYYLHLDTMKLFSEVNGQETLPEILTRITKCKEFSETLLRANDKKTLNTLNKCKYQNTIRFPLAGTIKTTEMKVNCIIQAIFGCLKIQNPSLLQESWRIMKIGKSIANCLVEYLRNKEKCFSALQNTLILCQCFNTKLWENSPYVSRQLPKIGPVLSTMLATAGKTTFKAILETSPRNLEMIINRGPPMGNEIQELVTSLPFYSLELIAPETNTAFNVKLVLTLLNADSVNLNSTLDIGRFMTLLVGDSENNILLYKKIFHNTMATCKEDVQYIEVVTQKNHIISAYLISQNWVGIDTKKTVEIKISNSIQSNSKYHSVNISPREITTPAKIIEKNPEIRTTNSPSITSYFKQVKNLPPNISSNAKKLRPQIKKSGVNKNEMKSITTYFPKQSKPGNIEQPKKQFSFRSEHDQQKLLTETTLMPCSLESGYGSYNTLQPALDNNKLSQVSNFYPSNVADLFQNVNDSIYCENSQLSMTPNKYNSQSNKINLNETLTQGSTQKKGNSLTKFLKSSASQKQRLTSHVSSKNFLSSLKQSVKIEPKKEVQELLSQFSYTPRKKIEHTERKNAKFSEYNSHIFEPESSKLGYPSNLDKKINNFDQEFDEIESNTPNNIEINKDKAIIQMQSKPREDNNSEEIEIVKIPKLADSFRDYVMKTVQKLKVNDEYNLDIGIEEFLLKPLNESYSDSSSSSSEEEEKTKDNITAIIPQNKLITKEQKNEEIPPLNVISSTSFNATNNFDVEQMLDNSLYKDYSFAKLNESINEPQHLPSTSFNITKNSDLGASFYKNIDKLNGHTLNDLTRPNIFENNNSFSFSNNLTFLPGLDLESQVNSQIDNNLTFAPVLESPPHDLSFLNNLDSEELKNMESSENFTDNSDNEAKKELLIENRFNIIEQWNNGHGHIYNENASDITFDSSSSQPIKKKKLANGSKFTVTKSVNDEPDLPSHDVFQYLEPFNKLISTYNSQYKNRISLSNPKMLDYEPNQQSAIIEKSTYSFCGKDNETIEMSVTIIEKERNVSETSTKFIRKPLLEQSQNYGEKRNKQKKDTFNRYPYFKH